MLASELLTQIRSTLVEPVAGFWTDTELLGWLTRAEADYNNRTRILEDVDTSSTVQGINKYVLPSNCLSIRAVSYNDPSNSTPNWKRLVPSNLEKMYQQNPNFMDTSTASQGQPRAYMIWDRTLYIFPTPDSSGSGNLMLWYKSKPSPITATSSPLHLDDSLREALIAYVLWKAWEKERESDKADEQQQIYENYVKHGLRWQKKQSGDQRNRIDIVSPNAFEGPFGNTFNPLA